MFFIWLVGILIKQNHEQANGLKVCKGLIFEYPHFVGYSLTTGKILYTALIYKEKEVIVEYV